MATDVVIKIGGAEEVDTVQVSPEVAIALEGVAGAATLRLVEPFGWGDAENQVYLDPMQVYDGDYRRAQRWTGRDFTWMLQYTVNPAVVGATHVEAARHACLRHADALLWQGGQIWLHQERENIAGAAVASQIRAEPMRLAGWNFSPQGGPGLIGSYRNTVVQVPVAWRAHQPWFRDRTPTASSPASVTFSTTPNTFTLTNLGKFPAPLYLAIRGVATATGVTIQNTTTGRTFVWSNQALHATNATVLDFFFTDPQAFLFYQATTNLRARQESGSEMLFVAPGTANTFQIQVTGGTAGAASCSVEPLFRNLWNSP